ncbi:hypothetical protein M0R72_15560 [Candidatus Pacearchaeota archaeon]|jgi:hypothetical protein|nr:hypothetical protein [Candidatus Pacearchaeota archaeon]
MAKYIVTTEYKDGTRRMLETTDGAMAMQEASSASWKEDQPKSVKLEKDGTTIWSENIEARKKGEAY